MDFSEPVTREECVSRILDYIANSQSATTREQIIPPLKVLARKSLDLCILIYIEARRKNDQKLWAEMELTEVDIGKIMFAWFNNPQADDISAMTPMTVATRKGTSIYCNIRDMIPELMKPDAMFLPSKLPPLPPRAFAANLGLEMAGPLPTTISVEDFTTTLASMSVGPLQQAEFLLYWFLKFPRNVLEKYEPAIAQHATDFALYMLLPKLATAMIQTNAAILKTGRIAKTEDSWIETLHKLLSRIMLLPYAMCMLNGMANTFISAAKTIAGDNINNAKLAVFNFTVKALTEVSVGIRERSGYSDEPMDGRTDDLLEFGVFYEMLVCSLQGNTKKAEEDISLIIMGLLQADVRSCQSEEIVRGAGAYAINVLLHVVEHIARARDDSTIANADKIMNLQGTLLTTQIIVPYRFDLYIHTKALVMYKSLMMRDMRTKLIIEKIFDDMSWPSEKLTTLMANLIVHATLYCYAKKTPFWDRLEMLDVLFNQARKIQSRDLACFVLVMALKASFQNDEGTEYIRAWAKSSDMLCDEINGLKNSICADVANSVPVSAIAIELLQEMEVACKDTVLIDRTDTKVQRILSVATYFDYFSVVTNFPIKHVETTEEL